MDSMEDMRPFGCPVPMGIDPEANKNAVDAICKAISPHYVMLLGAPDVVPHQPMDDPMGATSPDDVVDSDLPYASSNPYSLDVPQFIRPEYAVGRLTDITGVGNTAYLVSLLDIATGWRSAPRALYEEPFSLSAADWEEATSATLESIFGANPQVHLSPNQTQSSWIHQELRCMLHFLNCHGEKSDPVLYGQGGTVPRNRAYSANDLHGRVTQGTVVAAECCYGAQLYDPRNTKGPSICNTYLGEGAFGFFGSTTSTFGARDLGPGMQCADVICARFVRAVLEGASLGNAVLRARREYVEGPSAMSPPDYKTLAQFILLGDPSIVPVEADRTR